MRLRVFAKQDFIPVVRAFEDLIECFKCEKCQSSLQVTLGNDFSPNVLKCDCEQVSFKLTTPTKKQGKMISENQQTV